MEELAKQIDRLEKELEKLREKVQKDGDDLIDAAKDRKAKEIAHTALEKAAKDAKAEVDHANWHIDRDLVQLAAALKAGVGEKEAWDEFQADEVWRDGLQKKYEAAAKAERAADAALAKAKAGEKAAEEDLERDRDKRDQLRKELDQAKTAQKLSK